MAELLKPGEVASRKGCSKKTVHRACEQGKLNHEFDPVTGEYSVYDDEKLAAWLPGASANGERREWPSGE